MQHSSFIHSAVGRHLIFMFCQKKLVSEFSKENLYLTTSCVNGIGDVKFQELISIANTECTYTE